ncbi:MAG: Nif11-like leader peptide family natural product precursor [Cyanobacteriota bacterium]
MWFNLKVNSLQDLLMSEQQLTALLAKLKDDAGLREKLQGAADLDAVLALVKDAGFDVSKAEWLKAQASKILELSDEELENVAGGLSGHGCTISQMHLC